MTTRTASPLSETLFARLMFDVMIPAELAEAIQAQGYDVVEARTLPIEIQQDDHAILEAAAMQRCIVVTCNYSDP
jgi:predicted nuclease of predicted toxin-antitoxin system